MRPVSASFGRRRLGYHPHGPARQLAAGRTHVIALVLRQTPEQIAADAVLVETLRGLASAARTGGFRVLVEPLPPDGPDAAYESLLRAQQADGLIVSGPRLDDASLVALVEEDDFPIVIQGAFPGLAVSSVDVDNVGRGAGAPWSICCPLAIGESPASRMRRSSTPRPTNGTMGTVRLCNAPVCRSRQNWSRRPPLMRRAVIGRWWSCWAERHSMRSSWPATSSPWGRSERSAKRVAEFRMTYH